MPVLSDPRHERFAQNLAAGMGIAEALQLAGFDLRPWDASVADFYVYALADSAGEIFYIGKGKRRRCLAHERVWRRGTVLNAAQYERIGVAVRAGGVKPFVIASALDERAAYAMERRLIEAVGLERLTNAVRGVSTSAEKAQVWAAEALRRLKPFPEWAKGKPIAAFAWYWRVFQGLKTIAAGQNDHARA